MITIHRIIVQFVKGAKMEYTEKTVRKNYIYKGKILTLRCDDAQLFNGAPCKREIIEHSGGACVLCVEKGKVLLVRQYRYAYGESVYEIPAGKLNAGEEPALACVRELEEETGFRAREVELLYEVYPTPGYTNERIFIYLAKELEKVERHLDDGEFLDAEWIDLERVKEMLKKGEIKDAKTIIALQAYFLR